MDSPQEPNSPAMGRPEKNGLIYCIVGLVLALVIWGSQLIGLAVNVWFGGFVLAIAFVLMVCAFWIWERTSTWHVFLRVGTILLAAGVYFLMIGKQMISEWRKEHPIIVAKATATTPRAAQFQANPPPAPSIVAPAVPKKDGRKPPKAGSSAAQENRGGSGSTNTQIGTAQAPIVVAPNGIANAAPNFGNQTVNNFGDMPNPPLVLTDEQCSSISAALRPFKGQTVAISVSGSMVNDPFGKKLQGAMEAAGLTVKYNAAYMLVVGGIGTPPPGLSFSFGKNRKDILYVLAKQFQALGLVNKPMQAFDLGAGDDVADALSVFVAPPK